MDILLPFVVNTPVWVYGLFIYLIYIGVKASKTHLAKLSVIFIIPLVLIAMSLHTLLVAFNLDAQALLFGLGAALFGLIVGWWQVFRYGLRIDKKHQLIQIPGTWSTLIVVLVMFATKYYFSYAYVTNDPVVSTALFEHSALIIFGMGTGFFLGKLLCYLYRFNTLEHSDLTQ